jgi:hypothetical protein
MLDCLRCVDHNVSSRGVAARDGPKHNHVVRSVVNLKLSVCKKIKFQQWFISPDAVGSRETNVLPDQGTTAEKRVVDRDSALPRELS